MEQEITRKFLVEFIERHQLDLQATQPKLCIPIIVRLYKKMAAGIKFPGIKISESLICDGHHRYLAAQLANVPLDRIPGHTTTATIKTDWKLVSFDEEDWDTETKINFLNTQDALFNDIPLSEIIDLLK